MSINTQQIESIFDSVSSIVKKYDDMALQSGEKFNVFDIIGLRNDEVRMHSAMLANLLDAQGSHGMKGKFLELFIKMLDENNILWRKSRESSLKKLFDSEYNDTNCISELYAGPKTEDEGGRIDLYIYDSNNNALIIENKIYAPEQYKQLIRYNNFNKEAPILFLTLYGDEPSSSIDEITKKDISKSVYCISYKTDILKWLESCHKEASDKPLIREGIKHYINLIKIITNQTMSIMMDKEIKKIVNENIELVYELNGWYKLINEENFIKTFNYFKKLYEKLGINHYDGPNEFENEFGLKNRNFYFYNSTNCNLFFYFDEKNIENLYLGIEVKNILKYEKLIKSIFPLIEEKNDNTIWIKIDEHYNELNWDNLLDNKNIDKFAFKIQQIIDYSKNN
jgi:hypothetical protein